MATIIERNVNDFCRLCAGETISGVVIYSSEGLHLCLEEKILQCLRIEISKEDVLPKKVCCPCQTRLEESHRFAVQANEVQRTLELLVQKSRIIEQNIDVKLEELDIKDEINDLPLDVTIETASERKNESKINLPRENYNIAGVQSSTVSKNQVKTENARRDECSNRYASKLKKQHQKTDSDLQSSELETNKNAMCSFPSPSQCLVSDDAENTDANEQEKRESDEDVKERWEVEEEEIADEYEIEENVEEMNIINDSESHNEFQPYKLDGTTNDDLIESEMKFRTGEEEEEEDDDDDEEGEEGGEKDVDESTKEEWKTHWGIKCNECDEVFPYRSQFDKHYRGSYDKIPIYTCSYCNKSMEKYSTFRSHCYRHVTEGRYRCEYCQKGFSLRSMLHVHILAKHTSVKPFICEECGKGFVTRPGLNIHLKKHKNDEKQEYPCSECGKIFAEKSHLNRHNSFHSEKRPFQCTVCLKTYKTERCLKVHAMVHSEARPYVCTYCNKGFLSSTKLKQHYNIHTGERPYACKFCERTFTNYPNWLKHTRRRHKEFLNVGSSAQNTSSQTAAQAQPQPQSQEQHHHQHQQEGQEQQHEQLFQHQHSQHNPDRRNSLDNSGVSAQTQLSDVSSQLSETCMDPANASSLEMLQQYSRSEPTKLEQTLSPHDTQKCQVISHQPAHHQPMEQTFSLPQVYPDHLISIHPHNILPL
ncbi:Protein suppressor of hairy wing [Gryllus bimaculatus]|nr:Protein suppressor of hairy wing [Gryllus bimaculatus]